MPRSSPIRIALRLLTALLVFLSAARPAAAQEEAVDDPALQQYFLANGAYNRKLYPVAIQQFTKFLDAHPDHPKADLARRGLALSYYASKKYAEAIPPLTTLLDRAKLDEAIERERLVIMKGQCLLVTGEADNAQDLYLAELPNLKSAAFRQAALATICDVSFTNAAWEEVLKWSAQLLKANPEPARAARALYQQGYAHYQSQNPEAAVAALRQIDGLDADPVWNTRTSLLLGECYHRLKQYENAEAAFLAALPGLAAPEAAEAHYRLGLTRFALDKHEEAATDFEASLAAAPDGPHAAKAKFHLARTALERGDFAKAAAQFAALSTGDDTLAARASLWLARVHTRSDDKDYAKAAEILAKAVEAHAQSALIDDLRFDYANALMARPEPDWQTALASLQHIAPNESFPQQAEVASQSAVCQQKLGDYDASLATCDRFLATFPDHPLSGQVAFLRAENLFLSGRLDDAAKACREFLASHPEHPDRTAAAFRLTQIHHSQERWNECLAAAAPLLSNMPAGPLYAQLPFFVGDAHFRQENWADAIGPLEEFLAGHLEGEEGRQNVRPGPNIDTALIQLAIASDRTGQPEKALAHLRILADRYPAPSAQLPLALAELGRLAFERGDLELARQSLNRFLAADKPDDEHFAKHAPAQRPRVRYYLGWIDAQEDQPSAAALNFAEVVKLAPEHPLAPDAALQEGIALLQADEHQAAADRLAKVLADYPEHPKRGRVVFHAGLALARLEQWEQAAAQFNRVAEQFADSDFADRALYEWAWCERAQNRLPEASKLYERLLADHPDSPLVPKVQSELAELTVDPAAQDKVIAQLTAAANSVEDDALREEILYQLAVAHYRKGDHEQASARFAKLIDNYPQSKRLASMHFQAGESLYQLERIPTALDHFAAAAGISGSPPSLVESVTMRLAECQALTGKHDEAGHSYASFLDQFPESKWTRNARFGLAHAIENAGDPKSALPEYAKLLADATVDLWTVRSRYRSGLCHAALKQNDQALVEFVNVEISYPQYPAWQARAILEIGRLLLKQNQPEQARERFEDVIRRFPDQDAAANARKQLDALPEP